VRIQGFWPEKRAPGFGVSKPEEVGEITEEEEESAQPAEALVVARAGGKQAHMGSKVSVGGNYVEVNLFDFSLVPLLEKAEAKDPCIGVDGSEKNSR